MLHKEVVQGAILTCTYSNNNTVNLKVDPENNPHKRFVEDKLSATVDDYKIEKNIPPFKVCTKIGKCLPNIMGPWMPGAKKVFVNDKHVLTKNSTCVCKEEGIVSVVNPNQTRSELESK